MTNANHAESRWGLGRATQRSLCPRGGSCTTHAAIAPTAEATIKLPWTAPPLSMNQGGQTPGARMAKAKKIKAIRQAVASLAATAHIDINNRFSRVQLHYVPRDNRRRDTDNLVSTLKPICDGLVEYGLVPDDTPQFMAKPEPIIYRYTKGIETGLWVTITTWKEYPDELLLLPTSPFNRSDR